MTTVTEVKPAISPLQVNSFPRNTEGFTPDGQELPRPADSVEEEEQFMATARLRFQICVEAESERRNEMLQDLQFSVGEQWDTDIKNKRTKQGRPSHTINRIPEFTDHVVNNMRQARPGIKVDPVGDGADQDDAEVRQGLIRYIERISQAEIAYDTGYEAMCIMGLGWIRILEDWSSWDSFDQDLFIRWVANPFCVYSDPNCLLPDWSDMKYLFYVDDLTPDDFKAQFGKDRLASSADNFKSIGDQSDYWYRGGKIRIAEYFRLEMEPDVLYEFLDGTTGVLSELGEVPAEETYNQKRKCFRPQVYWSLIDGLEKLREKKLKGTIIPFIPVIGKQVDVDGKRLIIGMVRYAREIQRMYNYIYSTLTETIALMPKNQFIAEFDQVSEFFESWKTANTDPQAVLVYKRQSAENGSPIPPPTRQSADVAITGLIQALQIVDNMLKSVFGIYDASLGQRGPQESGLAINARKIESDTSTFNWADNFHRALNHVGRVLNCQLQYYYNKPGRVVRILREDQSEDVIVFNQIFIDKNTKQPKKYDLGAGKFSVSVSVGPSDYTKRRESSGWMLEMAKAYPPLMQIAGDLVFKEMDNPGHQAIAKRLEKALPPGLKDPDDGVELPPEYQKKMADLQQLAQQLTQALHAATDKKDIETTKQLMETFRTEMTNETNRFIALLQSGDTEASLVGSKLFEQAALTAQAADPKIEEASSSTAAPQGQPAPVQPGQQPALAGPDTGPGQVSGGGQ